MYAERIRGYGHLLTFYVRNLVIGLKVTNNTETLRYVYTWNSENKYVYDAFHVL